MSTTKMPVPNRDRILRAIRRFGWNMNQQQQAELIARLDAKGAYPIPMRYTRKIRAQLRSGSASVFFCVTDHGDIKCSNGVLTWDSAD